MIPGPVCIFLGVCIVAAGIALAIAGDGILERALDAGSVLLGLLAIAGGIVHNRIDRRISDTRRSLSVHGDTQPSAPVHSPTSQI